MEAGIQPMEDMDAVCYGSAVIKAGIIAVAADHLGLPIGGMALTRDAGGGIALASDLWDNVTTMMTDSEPLRATSADLVAKYLSLAIAERWLSIYTYDKFSIQKMLYLIARHSLFSYFEKEDNEIEHFVAQWFCNLETEVMQLHKTHEKIIIAVCRALRESRSLSEEEIKQVISTNASDTVRYEAAYAA